MSRIRIFEDSNAGKPFPKIGAITEASFNKWASLRRSTFTLQVTQLLSWCCLVDTLAWVHVKLKEWNVLLSLREVKANRCSLIITR